MVKNRFSDRTKLILLFAASVIFYFIISDFNKSMFTLPDELRYFEAARALVHGKGLEYNGIICPYQKILYSVFISPAFLADNVLVQIKLVALINSLMVASTVFPVYLLCREEELEKNKTYFMCLFTVLFPETVATMTFMSENLYYPLWIWIVYLVFRGIKKEKTSVTEAVILGILGYLLYFCKEVGGITVPAYFLLILCMFIKKKADRSKLLNSGISLIAFVVCYLLIKHLIFPGTQNTYHNQLDAYEQLADAKGLAYAVYAGLYTMTYIFLSLYVFPVFLPVKRKTNEMAFFIYLIFCITAIAASVVYAVTLTEELFSPSPRLYLRYLSPLTIPVMSSFLASFDGDEKSKEFKWKQFIPLGIYVVILSVLPVLNERGLTDSSNLEIFRIGKRVLDNALFFVLIKTIYLAFITGGVILFIKKRNIFLKYFLAAVFVCNLLSYGCKIIENRSMYAIPAEEAQSMREADECLDALEGRKLLIIGGYYDHSSELAMTYHDSPDVDFYNCSKLNDEITLYAHGATRKADLSDYSYFMIDRSVINANEAILDKYCADTIWESDLFVIRKLIKE